MSKAPQTQDVSLEALVPVRRGMAIENSLAPGA